MKDYLFKAHIWIEADSLEEAEEIYEECEWTIDSHEVFTLDINGNEIEAY